MKKLLILNIHKFRVELCGVLLKEKVEHDLGMINIPSPYSTLSYLAQIWAAYDENTWSDIPTDKLVLSCGPKISKTPLKMPYWWLKTKERNLHFWLVKRRFLAAINYTGSAEEALVSVLLHITHWTKGWLPVLPGFFRQGGIQEWENEGASLPSPFLSWTMFVARPFFRSSPLTKSLKQAGIISTGLYLRRNMALTLWLKTRYKTKRAQKIQQ